jgi:hypothetical protein
MSRVMNKYFFFRIFQFDSSVQLREVKGTKYCKKNKFSNSCLIVLLLVAVLSFQGGWGQVFYSKGNNLNVNSISSWVTNPDGTGSFPLSFSLSNQEFIVQNGHRMAADGIWVLSGVGSKVVVKTGGAINANGFNHALTLDMENGGAYIVTNSYSSLVFGNLHSNSNFQLDGVGGWDVSRIYPNVVQNNTGNFSLLGCKVYGDLIVNTGNTCYVVNSGISAVNATIKGTIVNNGTFIGNNAGLGLVTLNLGGSVNGNFTAGGGVGGFALNFTGGQDSVNFAPTTYVSKGNVTVASNKTVNLGANVYISNSDVCMVNGTLSCGTNAIQGLGSVNISDGATLKVGSTSTLGAVVGNVVVAGGLFLNPGSTVEFNGFSQQFIASRTFSNLKINNTSGVNLISNIVVNKELNISAGSLGCGTFVISGSGTVKVNDGVVLKVGSTSVSGAIAGNIAATGGLTLDVGSTVEFNGNNVQRIASRMFSKLLINNSNGVSVIGDVELNDNLTITSIGKLTVETGRKLIAKVITNNAGASGFILENNASLIQTTNVVNTSAITVKRNSSLLKRFDYTLWSSPVQGQNLRNFSASTLINRFYEYNTLNSIYADIFPSNSEATTNFSTAKGYMIMAPDSFSAVPAMFGGVFIGIPNNGDINFSLNTTGNGYNAVGNPYPSAINIERFINSNTDAIEGTLWFWRTTSTGGGAASYSTCTSLGCVVNNSHDYPTNATAISIGQGFFVKTKTGVTGVPALNFTNTMRVASGDQFFRLNNELSRICLKISNSANQDLGQKVIVYTPNATYGYDSGLDGLYMNESPVAFYSKAGVRDVVINARPGFNVDDVVPLVFKTNTAGNYTVSLNQLDGLFVGDQPVYLRDSLTGIVHDLKTGAYTFVSESGVFTDRFDILYQNALSVNVPVFNASQVVVYKVNNELVINTGNNEMTTVKIFDLSGRIVVEKKKINTSEVRLELGVSDSVFLVQIVTKEGLVVTKKIIL